MNVESLSLTTSQEDSFVTIGTELLGFRSLTIAMFSDILFEKLNFKFLCLLLIIFSNNDDTVTHTFL